MRDVGRGRRELGGGISLLHRIPLFRCMDRETGLKGPRWEGRGMWGNHPYPSTLNLANGSINVHGEHELSRAIIITNHESALAVMYRENINHLNAKWVTWRKKGIFLPKGWTQVFWNSLDELTMKEIWRRVEKWGRYVHICKCSQTGT